MKIALTKSNINHGLKWYKLDQLKPELTRKDPKRSEYQNLKLLLLYISLLGRHKDSKWYLNSGCTRYVTKNRSMFLDLQPSKGSVSYGSGKGKIIGKGKIGKHPLPTINGVTCVEGLKYNVLSISQFCDRGYVVSFNKDERIV